MVSVPAFQAGDTGSNPVTRSSFDKYCIQTKIILKGSHPAGDRPEDENPVTRSKFLNLSLINKISKTVRKRKLSPLLSRCVYLVHTGCVVVFLCALKNIQAS